MSSGVKLTQEDAKQRLINIGAVIPEDFIYINSKSKVKLICPKCDIKFEKLYYDALHQKQIQCKICGYNNTGNKLRISQEEAINRTEQKGFKLLSIYKSRSSKIAVQCKCGRIYDVLPSNLWRESTVNCGQCIGSDLQSQRPEISVEWDYLKNYPLTPNNVQLGCNKKVWWKCQKCNNIYMCRISNRTYLDRGCPICSSKSKGEDIIYQYLTERKIPFYTQYSINGLIGIGGRLLKFDFYLPEDNLFIEYQGEHHYKEWRFKNKKYAEDKFQQVKTHDQIKRDFCLANQILLLEIKYTDFDQIEQILEKYLTCSAGVL